jgi:hypothetical protein
LKPIFFAPFYTKNDLFAKTGSGQTQEKLRKASRVFFQDGVLSKPEWRQYLEAIGAWGQGEYVDSRSFDDYWPVECQLLQSDLSEGVRASAFEVRKRISFAPFYTKSDHFAKTGSGQT